MPELFNVALILKQSPNRPESYMKGIEVNPTQKKGTEMFDNAYTKYLSRT